MTQDVKYVVITPVRDEEKHMEATIEAVAGQTIRPTEWVIVNDGSSDRTGEIIDRYAAKFPWISVVHRSNRGFRKSGGGVVEAFYDGYNALHRNDWDFVVKLDGDLTFAPEFILKNVSSILSATLSSELAVGRFITMLGECRNLKPIRSSMSEEQPRSIGETVGKRLAVYCELRVGTRIDEVKANMLGWKTYSFPRTSTRSSSTHRNCRWSVARQSEARHGLLRLGISPPVCRRRVAFL